MSGEYSLGSIGGGRPKCLTIDEPATNLAALVRTDSLAQLTDTILKQWQAPEAFAPLAKHGIYPIRQCLFYGAPGNGKTSGSQWLAKQLDVPLFRVRCEQLVKEFLGATAKNLAELMEWLAKSQPAVVLLDEVESLFPSRATSTGNCGREMNSAMTVYWQHLDRWKARHVFVLATNMRQALDPALLSRLELQLEFAAPTEDQARQVIAYWSETLHQYGADEWAPRLLSELESGPPESFRSLWQVIQRCVSAHVTRQLG